MFLKAYATNGIWRIMNETDSNHRPDIILVNVSDFHVFLCMAENGSENRC
ncbi:MAG: hypothetical protein PHW52_04370 [Candidatus Pacebacteria bacterium]|nr:hypothetical protein [Candidatus Paceibacterota bacterium]